MIQYIRGELALVEEDRVIVDVGGVGYGIFMPVQSISQLPGVGNEVRIYTYLNVKEDAMQLFGFLTRDDLKVFKLLIGVNGIGPKGGQAVLSVLSPDDLRFAVLANDVKAICAAPGIGKKTAEKVILELKDKLSLDDVFEHSSEDQFDACAVAENSDVQSEAIQALVALGYNSTDALKAVKKVEMTEAMDVEALLKQALTQML